jgi:hypothetical protein
MSAKSLLPCTVTYIRSRDQDGISLGADIQPTTIALGIKKK